MDVNLSLWCWIWFHKLSSWTAAIAKSLSIILLRSYKCLDRRLADSVSCSTEKISWSKNAFSRKVFCGATPSYSCTALRPSVFAYQLAVDSCSYSSFIRFLIHNGINFMSCVENVPGCCDNTIFNCCLCSSVIFFEPKSLYAFTFSPACIFIAA